jgi:chitinase
MREKMLHLPNSLKVFILTACFSVAAGIFIFSGRHATAAEPVIGAYFPRWVIWERNYQVTNIPAAQVTHIFYAFVAPDYRTNRAVLVSDPVADATNFPALRKLKQKYPHLKTLISVGGANSSQDFSDIMASAVTRTSLVEACASFMVSNGFDGVDLDWEYPVEGGNTDVTHRASDATNFVSFLQSLRARLDAQELRDSRDYLITAATSAGVGDLTNRYRLAQMRPYVDWFNLMTYSYSGLWDPKTGHKAPLYKNPSAWHPNESLDLTVQGYLQQGVPASQLVAGVTFHGVGYSKATNFNNGLFQSYGGAATGTWSDESFDFKDLAARYINTNGYVRYFDPVSRAPYLYSTNTRVFISYDDERSIYEKTAYAVSNGLRGVMCWSIEGDARNYALQRAMYRGIYPLSFAYLRIADQQAGKFKLAWHGVQGETFTLAHAPTVSGSWTTCTGLTDTNAKPMASLLGTDGVLTVVHTLATATQGFYRVSGPPLP